MIDLDFFDKHYYCNGKLLKKSNNLEIGWLENTGYRRFKYKGNKYSTHVIIYWYHNQNIDLSDKSYVIDHIDNNKLNNKVENLQKISYTLNKTKGKARKDSSTKIRGMVERNGKYRVCIGNKGKVIWLKTCTSLTEAQELRKQAEHEKFKGNFDNWYLSFR